MKKHNQFMSTLFGIIMIGFFLSSCQKSKIESSPATDIENAEINAATNAPTPANPNFNLEVILRGEGKRFGHVTFRQANDIDKIVTLDTWLRDMEPNHEYKLQRAVDTNLDGNCTGTAWLTLGKGLTPQSIFTNDEGTGREELFRNLSAFPSGATFDIHFQVIDAVTGAVVLMSDCYQFTVR
jgi:hypothetical protein